MSAPGAGAKEPRPIIVKKVKRTAAGHHGGAWKVAYADFVTAMMAFFMVMWLIAAVSKEQRAAIFDYFKNPSMEQGKSVKPSKGQMGPGGASTSVINMGGGLDARRSSSPMSTGIGTPRSADTTAEATKDKADDKQQSPTSVEEARRLTEEADHKKLESLLQELRKAIDMSQALKPFKDQLLLDITPEGLRIQIVDAQNRPMFDLGSAKLKDYTATILRELAPYLNTVPNRISLSGHTDTTPYMAQNGATNWDLSADRANAARRALEGGGLSTDKIARIVGLSSSVLFDKSNPRNAINRRISIIVMTKQAEEAALATDTAPQVQAADLPAGVSPAGASEPATGTAAPASAVAH
ncbi:MAG TPA: flagellar motor protein MotB [Steroidobacteraceae bacterium]|nr:flagellar motor protein MotB [Steroidobacteraceae bacterium]